VRIALTALACTMALNVLVVFPAAKLGFPVPHVLLATSTCIGAAINTVLLWRGLIRAGVLRHAPGWGAFLWRVLLANLAMALVLRVLGGDLIEWTTLHALQRVSRLAGSVLLAASVYFAVLFGTGLRYQHLRSLEC